MKFPGRAVKYVVAGNVCLVSAVSAFAGDAALPSGWRLPTSSELSDDWRNKDPEKYATVRGDFNGDGVVDAARLLVSLRGQGMGLFVFLSKGNQSFRAYKLNVIKDVALLQAMGISKVLPGKYDTACGKGYWKCKKGEASEISTENDAIAYFKTESASSYFYWDKRENIFRRIWISD